MILGSTGLVAILGSPIAQVKSPENFNRWFQANALDLAMLPIDMTAEALPAFIATLRGWNNLRGCVVTVPYKQSVVPLLDELSPRAKALNSANVIRREADGRLIGDNVDGEGFLKAGRAHGFDPKGKRGLVLGSGGVGAAIAYSLAQAGVARLTLSDPRPGQAEALGEMLREQFPAIEVKHGFGDLSEFDLLVNASPIGMGDTGETPLPHAQLMTLSRSAHVADVVTKPAHTPLLAIAKQLGCSFQEGPEMARAQMGDLGYFMGVMPLDV